MQHFAGKTGHFHKNTQNLNVTQQMVQTAVRLAAATKAEAEGGLRMADIVMAYAVVAYIGDGHAVPFEVKGNDCVAYCGKLEVSDVMLLDATHPHAGPAPGDTRRIGDTMHGHACACVHMAMHMWRQSCICSTLHHSAATVQPACVTL